MFWLRCNKIMAHLEIIPSSISQGRLTVNANHDSLTFMISWFCFQEVIIKREIPQQRVWDFTLSWHLDGCRLLPSSDWSIVITSLVFIECRLSNKHFTMSTENSRSVFWHCSWELMTKIVYICLLGFTSERFEKIIGANRIRVTVIMWLSCEGLSHNHNLNLHYWRDFPRHHVIFSHLLSVCWWAKWQNEAFADNLLHQNAKNHEFWKYKPQRQLRCPSGWNTAGKSCTKSDVDRAGRAKCPQYQGIER